MLKMFFFSLKISLVFQLFQIYYALFAPKKFSSFSKRVLKCPEKTEKKEASL